MTAETAYTIEVRSGPLFGEEVVRSIEVPASPIAETNAIDLIESYREYYANRNEVVWDGEEVNDMGVLNGLAPGGVVYRLVITPPLPVEAEPPTQPTLS